MTTKLPAKHLERIFNETQKQISMNKIQTKQQLVKELKNLQTPLQNFAFSKTITKDIWDRELIKRGDQITFFKTLAKADKETKFIGKTPRRTFYATYKKTTNSVQITARNNKGMFTKYTQKTLRKSLPS